MSKSFLEAGKKRLSGDPQREAKTVEVLQLRRENDDLKKLLGETHLESAWQSYSVFNPRYSDCNIARSASSALPA